MNNQWTLYAQDYFNMKRIKNTIRKVNNYIKSNMESKMEITYFKDLSPVQN